MEYSSAAFDCQLAQLLDMGFEISDACAALGGGRNFDSALHHLLTAQCSAPSSSSSDIVVVVDDESVPQAMGNGEPKALSPSNASRVDSFSSSSLEQCSKDDESVPQAMGSREPKALSPSNASRVDSFSSSSLEPCSKRQRIDRDNSQTVRSCCERFKQEIDAACLFCDRATDQLPSVIREWVHDAQMIVQVTVPEVALEPLKAELDITENACLSNLTWPPLLHFGQSKSWLSTFVLPPDSSQTPWVLVPDVHKLLDLWPTRSFAICASELQALNRFTSGKTFSLERWCPGFLTTVEDRALPDNTLQGKHFYCSKCGWQKTSNGMHLHTGALHNGCSVKEFSIFAGTRLNFRIRSMAENLEVHGDVNRLVLFAEFAAYWRADEITACHCVRRVEISDPSEALVVPQKKMQFQLTSTQNEIEAPTPDLFLHPLKDKQRQTFGWMCHMEGVLQHVVSKCEGAILTLNGYMSTQDLCRRFHGTDLEAVVRLQRIFRTVSGGILADAVGYGKTCCMLALVAATRHLPPPNDLEAGGLLSSKATLIVTPPNLYDQWKCEAKKFLGDDSVKLVAINSAAQLQHLTVKDIVEADIVLVPYRIFLHESYRKHCDSISEFAATKSSENYSASVQYSRAYNRWVTNLGKELRKEGLPAEWLYGWPRQPPQDLLSNPIYMAFLEKHPMPQRDDFSDRILHRDNKDATYQTKRVLRLEAVARRLCKQLAEDPQSVLPLRGPALELFCFRRICFDEFHEVTDLKQRSAGNESLAFNAIRLIRAPRRWGLTATPRMETATDVSRMAEILQIFLPPDTPVEAQNFLDHFMRSNSWDTSSIPLQEHRVDVSLNGRERALYMSEVQRHGEKSERCVQLCSHFSPDETCKDSKAAVESIRRKQQDERSHLESRIVDAQEQLARLAEPSDERRGLAISLGHLQRSLATLDTSIRYFETTLSSLDPAGSSIECSVCLDDASGSTLALTSCGHLFHEACIQACVQTNGTCPECRKHLGSGTLIRVSGLAAEQGELQSEDAQRYGSKLCLVISRARELCSQDPDCKIIIFVQWEALLKNVHAALSECGFPCLRISGTVQTRQRILHQFKNSSASAHRVLLLSLEKSPSGMTLTCANHVFLIHPMFAESAALAAGYERQAIGRIRRPGQEKTVHVWRFVTSGTVEETLSQQNSTLDE